MFLEKITWKQAEGYFKEKDIAIIPVGSTENHGSQLCLGTDFLIPRRLCEMMDERLNILIAPTVPFGVGDQHINFPGTITIGYDGLYDLMTRIVDQLYGFGIRKFVFLNGHGGNTPVLQRVALELDERHAIGAILNWWLLAGELDPRWKGGHGGGEETAAILGIDPSLVDQSEVAGPMKLHDVSDTLKATGFTSIEYKGVTVNIPRLTPSVTHNGWIGPDHPETATEEWGRKMLQTTADYIADFMEEFKKVDIAKACGTEF